MQTNDISFYLEPPQSSYKNPFVLIFVITIALFFALGLYLRQIKPVEIRYDEKKMAIVKTQFLMAEKKKPPKPKPKPAETKEVIDLTKAPLLNQKTDFVSPDQPPPTVAQPPARPVYGLRRVFSTGLGSGGSAADAVIGKRGNTLNKDIDTITATKHDFVAPLVSISTVTSAPSLKHDVRPVYTKEMLAAKVEGVVKAELLVDGDGKVKEVRILSDLGFGTKESAMAAFLQWEFAPAMRDGKPVATWISFSIRFVFLKD